ERGGASPTPSLDVEAACDASRRHRIPGPPPRRAPRLAAHAEVLCGRPGAILPVSGAGPGGPGRPRDRRREATAGLFSLDGRRRARPRHRRPTAGQPAVVLPLPAPPRRGRGRPGRRLAQPEAAEAVAPTPEGRGRGAAAGGAAGGRAVGGPRPG